ncbi:MAG: SPOR domain-containing protein [candidate division Zixibacteria bacterium]|nr:SPOR domain-containing protein [candidate division Zixibacteria bacterium]
MKLPLILFLALSLFSGLWADDSIDRIFDSYMAGNIADARAMLSRLPQSAARDGNRLFISALFESDGTEISNKLKAALKSNLDGKYIEEVHFRILQIAQAQRDTALVLSNGKSFIETWETSRYRKQVLGMLAAYSQLNSKEQRRYLNLIIDEQPGGYYGQFARMIVADNAFNKKHYKTATTYCRRVNNAVDDNLTPTSLIMLSHIGLINGDAERALFNYSIIREQYRYAIGEDILLESLKDVSDSKSGQESTEVFEGITYSIKVGVFSVKDNAKRMEKRIEGYGYKVKIKRKNISGKSYYVVLAGRFRTMKEAQTAKQRLEQGEDQIFEIVVQDES